MKRRISHAKVISLCDTISLVVSLEHENKYVERILNRIFLSIQNSFENTQHKMPDVKRSYFLEDYQNRIDGGNLSAEKFARTHSYFPTHTNRS